MGITDRMRMPRRARLWARAALGGASVALLALALAACNGSTAPAPGPNSLSLSQVHWCDQPSVNFQDDGKLSHPILTDWNQVKDQLGFAPYLPASMPKGTCLALVGGSIHDPIFGGHFRITYDLPGNVPLSFSEAPKQTVVNNLGNGVQCSQVAPAPTIAPVGTPNGTPQPTPSPALSVCVGNIANTNVSLASPQPSATLQQMFSGLQANPDWVPQQGGGANPTATATSKA
ncbi:MAG TPA: hypothetical protein VIG30_14810 [Ktedonobacterales bacterium]